MATEPWSIPTTPTPDERAVLAELRGASKRFGTGAAAVDAVRDVDLTIGGNVSMHHAEAIDQS